MKWRARAFNVLLSSARQRLTPLFSNYFLQICAGEERQRRGGGARLPPAAPGSSCRGDTHAAALELGDGPKNPQERGWRKGRGRSSPERGGRAGRRAAFTQAGVPAAKTQLTAEIPPGCDPTRVGTATEEGGLPAALSPCRCLLPLPEHSCDVCSPTSMQRLV